MNWFELLAPGIKSINPNIDVGQVLTFEILDRLDSGDDEGIYELIKERALNM